VNVGGAKVGSIGIKQGSSEIYLVFSVQLFFFFTPTTLYIAIEICSLTPILATAVNDPISLTHSLALQDPSVRSLFHRILARIGESR
jgi:hypothetical protein